MKMGALDKVMQMRQQGYTEQQITQALQEEGISPKKIKEALDQSNIKSAVNQEQDQGQMQESIMQTQEVPSPNQQQYQYPQQAQYQQQDMGQYPQQEEMQQGDMQQYYQYPQQDYQYQYSSDNVSEIAEGIIAEKTEETKKQITKILNAKKILQNQISNLDERLKRIEKIIDQLQVEIIGKVADYGKDMKDISKEMKMMQNSFSKMINPILDKKRSKKKDNFEKYLR